MKQLLNPLSNDFEARIRSLRREVRLIDGRPHGHCSAVASAIEARFGYRRRWGHLALDNDTVWWIHCWNELADGSVLDSTADQFEHRFPGDIVFLDVADPLAGRYQPSPPGRLFVLCDDRELIRLAARDGHPDGPFLQDERSLGRWEPTASGWEATAAAVLEEMTDWPQPPEVRATVARHLRSLRAGSVTKRQIEFLLDGKAWESWRRTRGREWVPADLVLGPDGVLRRPDSRSDAAGPKVRGQGLGQGADWR